MSTPQGKLCTAFQDEGIGEMPQSILHVRELLIL